MQAACSFKQIVDTSAYFCIALWPNYELIWFKLFPEAYKSIEKLHLHNNTVKSELSLFDYNKGQPFGQYWVHSVIIAKRLSELVVDTVSEQILECIQQRTPFDVHLLEQALRTSFSLFCLNFKFVGLRLKLELDLVVVLS